MNWVEAELAPPPDPRDAWLLNAPPFQCEHRWRKVRIRAPLPQGFYTRKYETVCYRCKAVA
jgi:hypothetical protein